jgi:thiol-disulfide isomerase/thioredoxin
MERKQWVAAALIIAVAVSAVLAVVYLRGGRTSLGDADRAAGGDPGDSGAVVKVRMLREPIDVPTFTVTDLNGKTTSSAEWRGKVVLVNFWATWCPPCRAEIPDLIALQDKYRDKLVVLGVSEDEESIDVVKRFVADHHLNYPVVMSSPELRKLFPAVMALPTTFVLDRDGKMAQKNIGMLNARETEAGTRLLAGLKSNAEIVKVELHEKAVGLENAAQVREIPGIDLASLPGDKKTPVLLALNEEECTCGCSLTVAKCRIDDPTCPVSLPKAKEIVSRITSATR